MLGLESLGWEVSRTEKEYRLGILHSLSSFVLLCSVRFLLGCGLLDGQSSGGAVYWEFVVGSRLRFVAASSLRERQWNATRERDGEVREFLLCWNGGECSIARLNERHLC